MSTSDARQMALEAAVAGLLQSFPQNKAFPNSISPASPKPSPGSASEKPDETLNTSVEPLGMLTRKRKLRETCVDEEENPLEALVSVARQASRQSEEVSKARRTGSHAKSSWEEMFKRLVAFKDKHKHCNVTQRYRTDQALGVWVRTHIGCAQQQLSVVYHRGKNKITEERIEQLSDLGFNWAPNELEPTWNDMHELLLAFHETNGHCNVPRRYTVYPRLGTWVQTQRQAKRGTGPYKITPEHIKALDLLSFEWDPCQKRQHWDAMFGRLSEFRRQHGHANVPRRYAEDPELGRWVYKRRKSRRGESKYKITQEQIDMLDSLDFQAGTSMLQANQQKALQARLPMGYQQPSSSSNVLHLHLTAATEENASELDPVTFDH